MPVTGVQQAHLHSANHTAQNFQISKHAVLHGVEINLTCAAVLLSQRFCKKHNAASNSQCYSHITRLRLQATEGVQHQYANQWQIEILSRWRHSHTCPMHLAVARAAHTCEVQQSIARLNGSSGTSLGNALVWWQVRTMLVCLATNNARLDSWDQHGRMLTNFWLHRFEKTVAQKGPVAT